MGSVPRHPIGYVILTCPGIAQSWFKNHLLLNDVLCKFHNFCLQPARPMALWAQHCDMIIFVAFPSIGHAQIHEADFLTLVTVRQQERHCQIVEDKLQSNSNDSSLSPHLINPVQLIKIGTQQNIRPWACAIFNGPSSSRNNIHIAIVVVGFTRPKVLLIQRPMLCQNGTLISPAGILRGKHKEWVTSRLLKDFERN